MNKDTPEDFEVEDSENYLSQKVGIKDIAMRAYEQCLLEGRKEMIPGGTTTRIMKGQPIEIEIPNQREIFKNTVRSFEVVLNSNFNKFDEIKKKIKESNEDIKNAREDYNNQIWLINNPQKSKEFRAYSEESVKLQTNKQYRATIIFGTKYEMYVVELYRERLLILSDLIGRLNYFEESGAGT